MGKIARLIVEKRNPILVFFLLVAACSMWLMQYVNLNDDMTKYLPDNSSMKQGIDLMKAEFNDSTSCSFDIMFAGLNDGQKKTIFNALEATDGVASVDYESGNSDYNREDYTLYQVNVDYAEDSAEAKVILDRVTETYQDEYEIYTRGGIVNANTTLLPLWIIALALLILLTILFAMCASWFEPVLFLATIVIAIIINMGTNVFLDSVSTMTYSISAILQLVLSMDYSIILMNRYRQELETSEDKYEAMKKGLLHALPAILSSSVTTIVGLLALVFMSFKIGMDIGIVLAKGVLCSLICMLTILPALILKFDKLIAKTRKKVLSIRTTGLGAFSHKFRYVLAGVFVILFSAVFLLKGNTSIAYTLTTYNNADKIFPPSNAIVLLYGNDDEAAVGPLADELSANENIKSVSCYSNTLGKEYTADELADAIDDMGSDLNLDASLIDIVYYDIYANGETGALTLQEFVNFIQTNIVGNEAFADQIDADARNQLDRFEKLADPDEITRARTSGELAGLTGMDEDELAQLYLYYFSQHPTQTTTMTVQDFVSFIRNDVSNNEAYATYFDADILAEMDVLSTYADPDAVREQHTSVEMAEITGMDSDMVEQLYYQYFAASGRLADLKLSLPDFVAFLKENVASDRTYSSYFDESALAQIDMLATYTDPDVIRGEYTSSEMAALLGMDKSMTEQLYDVYFTGVEDAAARTMTPIDFLNLLVDNIANNEQYAAQFNADTLSQMRIMRDLMSISLNGTQLSGAELASYLDMDSSLTDNILYMYYAAQDAKTDWTMSLKEFVDYLLNDMASDQQYASYFDDAALSQMRTMQGIMDATVSQTQLAGAEMSALLGMDVGTANLLYAYFTSLYGDTGTWRMSLEEFVNFVVTDVVENEDFAGSFDASSVEELSATRDVIDSVLAGKEYEATEMTDLMNELSGDMDADAVDLIYLYYFSVNASNPVWTLTLPKLIDYASNDMADDQRFAGYFNAGEKAALGNAKRDLDEGLKQLKGNNYSRCIITTTMPEESEETTAFLDDLSAKCSDMLSGGYYMIGNSPMNYEMSQTFGGELDFITILTAIAIFAVVAIAFRSLLIPAVLVLIIQCAVYAMMCIIGIQGYSIYYIALLIVQCLLMGSTIDYGILYTTYYREKRANMNVRNALVAAYNGTIHTILTSALIMILMTGILGYLFENPTVGEICQSISKGALCATILIIFILPGILATIDKAICKRRNR